MPPNVRTSAPAASADLQAKRAAESCLADNVVGRARGRWLFEEAIVWIAFRKKPREPTPIIVPDPGPFGWNIRPDFMACLAARAAGHLEVWPEPGQVIPRWFPFDPECDETIPPDKVHALFDIEKTRTGMNDADLYAFALLERDRYATEKRIAEEQQTQLDRALDDLNQAVADASLVAWGRQSKTREKPISPPVRQPIPDHFIDEKRRIDRNGEYGVRTDLGGLEWLHDQGPFFYDIEVKTADVMRLWPALDGSGDETDRLIVPAVQPQFRSTSSNPHTKVRSAYSEKALAAWMMMKVHAWPTGTSYPTEQELLRMAEEEFESIPRDKFREIRKNKTPAEWRKRGPRRR